MFNVFEAVIGNALADQAAHDAAASRLTNQYLCAAGLADDISHRCDVARGDVIDCILALPENLLGLLDSPQGWTALSSFVAHALKVDSTIIPIIH